MEQSVGGVGVLDKALVVLGALEVEPRSLGDLVAVTGFPRATAHRLAVALEAHGLVRRDGDGRFCLGYRLVSLGRAAATGGVLIDLAEPVLAGLRARTAESVQLFVRDGRERVCLVSLESPNELRTTVEVGARLPLDRGSAGEVLSDTWGHRTGWTQSVGQRQAGVASVSAPVRDIHGRVVAAVSISGPIDRLGHSPGSTLGPAVQRAADEVSSRLE